MSEYPYREVEVEFLEAILEDLLELRAQWEWRKNESRCGYQKEYEVLCERIKLLESIIDK